MTIKWLIAVALAACLSAPALHAQDPGFTTGTVGSIGTIPGHPSFKQVRHPAQCPGHCYNHHHKWVKHTDPNHRDKMVDECTKLCQGEKVDHPGLQQLNPIRPTR